eukprot:3771694-Prymnesium_polylepis.1
MKPKHHWSIERLTTWLSLKHTAYHHSQNRFQREFSNTPHGNPVRLARRGEVLVRHVENCLDERELHIQLRPLCGAEPRDVHQADCERISRRERQSKPRMLHKVRVLVLRASRVQVARVIVDGPASARTRSYLRLVLRGKTAQAGCKKTNQADSWPAQQFCYRAGGSCNRARSRSARAPEQSR